MAARRGGRRWKHGVNKILLFGLPCHKDACGSEAYDDQGVVQQALRAIQARPLAGILSGHRRVHVRVHLPRPLRHSGRPRPWTTTRPWKYLARIAVFPRARPAPTWWPPRDMMDGRVAGHPARRWTPTGYNNTPILSYAVKYASSFYGPFRDAAGSAPAFGDRQGLSDGLPQPEGGAEGGGHRT